MNVNDSRDFDLCPEQESQFWRGYDRGWTAFTPGQAVMEPRNVSEDYRLGFWSGVWSAQSWQCGYDAATDGVLFCPIQPESEDALLIPHWYDGYAAAFSNTSFKMRGQA